MDAKTSSTVAATSKKQGAGKKGNSPSVKERTIAHLRDWTSHVDNCNARVAEP